MTGGIKIQFRRGSWLQTFTGGQFWPEDPRAGDVSIRDIAHSLSLQCRFAGHSNTFYSVAEHSIRVSALVPKEDALWGLLHDAAEAYVLDMPRPIKRARWMEEYCAVEGRVLGVIAARFGLTLPIPESVKMADSRMLMAEARDLLRPPPVKWEETAEPTPGEIVPMTSQAAEIAFLSRFVEINSQLGFGDDEDCSVLVAVYDWARRARQKGAK